MAATYFIFSLFFTLLSLAIVVLSHRFIRNDGHSTKRFNRATLYFGLSHIAFLIVPILHELKSSFQVIPIVLGNFLLVCSAVEALLLYRNWRITSGKSIERYVWVGVVVVIARLTYLQFYGAFADRVIWMTSVAIVLYGWQIAELFANQSAYGIFQRRAISVLLVLSAGLLFIRGQVVAGNVGHEYTSFLTEGIITIGIQWGWCTLVILNYLLIGSIYIENNLREQIRLAKELETSEQLNARLKDLLSDKNALLKRLSMAEKTGMLGALAGSLAHELNQPLCATRLNIDTLKQIANEQPEAKLLTQILNDVENDTLRVEKIVQRVDKLFRRGSSVFQEIQLSQLVHDCCGLLAKDMDKLHIALTIDIANDTLIVGDHGQLETVVLNLLSNAKDALQNTASARAIQINSTVNSDAVTLSITDNGQGIDPTVTDQIFDPFYTTKDHGMGIGLWLTKSIVEHHHARIEVTSNPNEGTRFDVTFLRKPF